MFRIGRTVSCPQDSRPEHMPCATGNHATRDPEDPVSNSVAKDKTGPAMGWRNLILANPGVMMVLLVIGVQMMFVCHSTFTTLRRRCCGSSSAQNKPPPGNVKKEEQVVPVVLHSATPPQGFRMPKGAGHRLSEDAGKPVLMLKSNIQQEALQPLKGLDPQEQARRIMKELNHCRSDPQSYADVVQNHYGQHRKDIIKGDNPNARFVFGHPLADDGEYYTNDESFDPRNIIFMPTSENMTAVNECVKALKGQKPVGLLVLDANLNQAAADHVNDVGQSGAMGHKSTDGMGPWDRMKRRLGDRVVKDSQGNRLRESTSSENINYGMMTARDIVVSLLVDDGIASRGHRKNILNEKVTMVGISFGDHHPADRSRWGTEDDYETMCVMDFASLQYFRRRH